MANPTCGLSTVGAELIRVRRLECDGTPVDELSDLAETAGYVTCKFTEITLTPEVLEGETIQQRAANGRLCINVQRDDEVTGYTFELEQCDIDVEFQEIIGSAAALLTNELGDSIGIELPGGTQSCSCVSGAAACKDVALEFWLQAYNCNEPSGYIRYVIPRIQLTEGANTKTFGNAATLTRFSGDVKPNTNVGATGPWGDAPAGVTLTGNAPAFFYEATLPAGLDAEACTYINLLASS